MSCYCLDLKKGYVVERLEQRHASHILCGVVLDWIVPFDGFGKV